MTKLKIDYSEARKQYIKGNYTDEGRNFPSLPEIAREFNYSLSTLKELTSKARSLKTGSTVGFGVGCIYSAVANN